MGKKKHSKRMKQAGLLAGLDAGGLEGLEALLTHGRRSGLAAMRPTEQFLLGALIGAGALYLLGDEQLRGKLIKAGLRLYSGIAGSFEEMKEQAADIQAEMAAEQQGGA